MKNFAKNNVLLLLFITILFIGLGNIQSIRADEVQELQQQIDELAKLKQQSEDATKPLEKEVANLDSKIKSAQAGIISAKKQLGELKDEIEQQELDLAIQYQVLSRRVLSQYKLARSESPLAVFLATGENNSADITKGRVYQTTLQAQDNRFVKTISTEIDQLELAKAKLEQDQVVLAQLEKQFDEQALFFKGEIAKAKDYQQNLTGKIAELSAKQQAILAARSGSFTTSAGNVPIGSDYNASIAGFRENAPSGSFAVFSFGAYTHRKGMSQYGAKARAESGQNYTDILKAYYGKEPENRETGGTISVAGYGDLDFETRYLYGIAEMPSDWPVEALKAQAIAARTYAHRYKVEGRTICTSESCQVFNNGKSNSVPENWKKAVDETRGQVLDGVVTFFSSTSGGYHTTSGWDTTDGNGSGDWTSRAWESKANSPWFYKAWYRQGYANSSSDCGRKPWLSEAEMADILNAWLVRRDPRGADTSRILPVTISSCSIGGQSGNPYSLEELKQYVDNPVTSITGNPTVVHNDQGTTLSVKFQTNRGEVSLSGSEFKETFNTRAPGYLSIPQSGFSFFNIERK